MTNQHLAELLAAAEAEEDDDGWACAGQGRLITLHAASGGASLTVSRIEALRVDGGLVKARTVRGEMYLLALADVFAGAVETSASSARRAGFV